MRALNGGVGSPGLDRRHGVPGVPDEKDSPTLELVGHLLIGLPRGGLDDLELNLLADGLGEHFAAILRRELRRRLTPPREIRGDEHAKVISGNQEYAVHVSVFDLHAIALVEVRNKPAPRRAKVDEDDKDRQ